MVVTAELAKENETRKLVSDDLGRVFFSIDCKPLRLMSFLVPTESL